MPLNYRWRSRIEGSGIAHAAGRARKGGRPTTNVPDTSRSRFSDEGDNVLARLLDPIVAGNQEAALRSVPIVKTPASSKIKKLINVYWPNAALRPNVFSDV
ncbi:hypothetical protein MRX96_020853 [Rhipicephalus microplus]